MGRDPLAAYDFAFPPELVAQKPARPRDSAKLLVYDRKSRTIFWDTFHNLPEYLPPHSMVVFNKTKVIPARLRATKETGGAVRLLYVRSERNLLVFLADRKLPLHSAVKVATGITLTVRKHAEQFYYLAPSFPAERILSILTRYGETPIPPYIKHSPLKEQDLRREYQAVFAKTKGSVAAPTASLHFTPALMRKLRRAGHTVKFVTLHVNLGTFAPLTAYELEEGKLHPESYIIDPGTARFLTEAKRSGRPIVAVGTTVVRALESAADSKGKLRTLTGETRLFIRPPYRLRFADALITNFHVPRSSLLLLVSAFLPRVVLLQLYARAIRRRLRLFSFGDGMLIV